jgi:hypothetical protein
MSAHTPGPWSVERKTTSAGYVWKVGPFQACIYRDYGGVCNPRLPHDEAEANARLIAAAPDLLEAARHAADEIMSQVPTISPRYETRVYWSQVAGVLRAAIAKAAG